MHLYLGRIVMASKKPENMTFEATIEELDVIVENLENGDLALEDALKKFERGIALARSGQSNLATQNNVSASCYKMMMNLRYLILTLSLNNNL